MKKRNVAIGNIYAVRVSGKMCPVRLLNESPYGGWLATNLYTRREIRVKTAGRLRYELVELGGGRYMARSAFERMPDRGADNER